MSKLTSLNFNTISNQSSVQANTSPLVLKEGQVIHGSITQLFPDQVAQVQVGANKLVAKLETPLKAGDSHYFQVTNTKGQLELKVVSGPVAQGTQSQQITQLLDSLNVPKSNEMKQAVAFMLKNDVPISKEQLIQMEAWLKAMPKTTSISTAMQAIGRMIEAKLPFTNQVFEALLNGSKATGMTTAVADLMTKLTQDASINVATKANITNQLQTIQQPLSQQVGANVLAQAVQQLMNPTASNDTKQAFLTMLKDASILPQTATTANWTQQLPSAQGSGNNYSALLSNLANANTQTATQALQTIQTAVSQDPSLTPQQKEQLTQQIQQVINTPKTVATINEMTSQLKQQFIQIQATQQQVAPSVVGHANLLPQDQLATLLKGTDMPANVLQQVAQIANQSEQPVIQVAHTQAEQQVQTNLDSKQVEIALKTIVKSLGLNYESLLASGKTSQLDEAAQSLKPQLMNLVNDSQVSSAVKDAAETLLSRINGSQLLSSENGHQHQIIMQVPLEFLGKQMDATLHWNGRMKENGKIDSDYARILFYLQMQSIDQTVIDMQVQNRIVSVTIFNENSGLMQLAEPLKQNLARGLEEKGYQLSGVFVKSFEQPVEKTVKKQLKDQAQGGVDIRI